MKQYIDIIRDVLIDHEEKHQESFLTQSKIVEKYQEQINIFDKNKIGYNFVFMFASPSYMLHKTRVSD